MDEIELLRRLGDDTPPPDPAARLVARAALLARAAAPVRRSHPPRLAFPLARARIPALVGAAAIVALAAGGLLPLGPSPDPAAAAALDRAAAVAAVQPAGPVGGYLHLKSAGAHLQGFGGTDARPNGVWALVQVSRELWVRPDGSGRLVESRGEPVWFGPADRAAWVAAGSPDFHDGASDTTFGPTPPGADPWTVQPWPGSLYYQDIASLPTDPAALRHMIDERAAAGGGATDYERFTIVGDLLRETAGTPQVRAALYRVAAGLGGVELLGAVTDRAGRTGTAVSMTSDQSSRGLERRTLVFDPATSALLAEEDVLLHRVDWLDAEPPVVIGYDTYLVSDIVPSIP